MANQAEKKAAANAAYWANVLQMGLAALNVLYVFSVLYSLKQNEFSWSLMMFVWPCVYAYLEWHAYKMVIRELASGLQPRTSQDLLAVLILS